MASYVAFKRGRQYHYLGETVTGKLRTHCGRRLNATAQIVEINENLDTHEVCWNCLIGQPWFTHNPDGPMFEPPIILDASHAPAPVIPASQPTCKHYWQASLLDPGHEQCQCCHQWRLRPAS